MSSILRSPMALTMALILTTSTVTNSAVEAATFAAFNSTYDLQTAVYSYCSDEANWESNDLYPTYGPIEQWNVSLITDSMSSLFRYSKTTCNPSIGEWDVSRVENFFKMFSFATSFNQPIGNWNVSSGTSFVSISFLKIDGYCSSSSTLSFTCFIILESSHLSMLQLHLQSTSMFRDARSFNQPIGNWDVSCGTDFVSKSSFRLILLC